jgi:hypothetical protein
MDQCLFAEEPLKICGTGTTCCTTDIEQKFYDDTYIQFTKINLMKDPYIRKLTRGRQNIGLLHMICKF